MTKTGVTINTCTVACAPSYSGDGYGYGGGAVLVIQYYVNGGTHTAAIPFGEGQRTHALCKEIARIVKDYVEPTLLQSPPYEHPGDVA
jgi:hypothetical protein